MQTTPTNEKAPGAANAQGHMQTGPQFRASADPLHFKPMTDRQQRMAELLLRGPASREQVDRYVGCANGPDEVGRFRKKYGVRIRCDEVQGVDRDGRKVKYGVYSLNEDDRPVVEAAMQAQAKGAQ